MRLRYVSTIELPSNLANRIQILQVSDAFSRLVDDFALFVRSYRDIESVRKEYAIGPFHIEQFRVKRIPGLQAVQYLAKVMKTLRSEKPDFIYVREPILAAFLSLFYNVVFELHKKDDTFIERICYFILSRRVKCIVTVNKNLNSVFKKYGCQAPIRAEPDGVAVKNFSIGISKEQCRKKCGLPKRKKIIGYVGRLTTMGVDKGFEHVLRALKVLRGRRSDFIFLNVGVLPSERAGLEEITKRHGLFDIVDMREYIPYNKVPLYLKSCDVLIIPYPWTEHFAFFMSPLKLFEYMASGVPIVSSDLPAIKQIIENGRNGVLYKHDDDTGFADALDHVLSDSSFASRIAVQARKDVDYYSWDNRAKRIIQSLKKCAA